MKPSQVLKEQLLQLLPTGVSFDQDELKSFGTDWSRIPGNALAVLFPRSTTDVVSILKWCSKEKVSVVPSGGRTGLVGGAVARNQEIVLSLSRMNKIDEIDPVARSVRVQAGAVTEAVHEKSSEFGLTWPIDLAAKGSSQIGGNLSTNAGGVRVVRYGSSRRWVTGIQAVLMSGDVLELNRGLEKNNTGYSLMQLLIGSEGTLAVITEATLKLSPCAKSSVVVFLAVESLEAIYDLFRKARRQSFEVSAFEFLTQRCLKNVEVKLNVQSKLPNHYPFYVLLELDSGEQSSDEVETWLPTLMGAGVIDGLVAKSSEEIKSVWMMREGITESIALTGAVRKYDVSVPVPEMVQFLKWVIVQSGHLDRKWELFLFGHFGDGSPHLNIVKKSGVTEDEFERDCELFEVDLFGKLKSVGGSISSEHGVGLLKKEWVKHSRTPVELDIFRAIKKSFDPNNLLNPNKLIP